MDGKLPLIPKSNAVENHDAGHIISDVFQDLLQKPKYPENLAQNMCKFNVESLQLKETACEVKAEIFKNALNVEDIAIVEQRLMRKHGKHLMREQVFQSTTCNDQRRLLKRRPLFTNIKAKEIEQFGLIKEIDLFPNKLERNMDFRINQNFHNCSLCTLDLDMIPVKLEKTEHKKLVREKAEEPKKQENAFRSNVDAVIFDNYQLNIIYKKRFKIQNVGSKPHSFYIEQLPKAQCFKIELLDGFIGKISPGMCAYIEVSFKTDIFLDVSDYLKIGSDLGSIEVNIASHRHAPNLCLFIHKTSIKTSEDVHVNFNMDRSIVLNECIDCGPCFRGDTNEIFLLIKNCGSAGNFFMMSEQNWYNWEALVNDKLDLTCGPFTVTPAYFQIEPAEIILMMITFISCEVGLNLDSFMLLCDNCTYENVDVVADCLMFDELMVKLESPEFLPIDDLINILFPVKDVDDGKSLGGSTSPQSAMWIWEQVMKQVEMKIDLSNLITQSSNTSIETIEMLDNIPKTDSELIIKYLKEIHTENIVPEDVEEPKFFGNFLIDYGLCLTNQVTSRTIYIYNNGPLNLNYYWIENNQHLSKLNYAMLKSLPKEDVELDNSGVLPAYSKTPIILNLKPSIPNTGFYDLHLSFFIKGIPKEAIEDLERFITCESSRKFVDVMVAKIELICKIEEFYIEFEPEEVLVRNVLKLGEEQFLEFKCNVVYELNVSVMCSWEISNPDIVFNDTISFNTETNHPFIVSFIISNRGYDDIFETMTLVVNGLYRKDIIIRAEVEKPALTLLEKHLDLGKLELGLVYSKRFIVENKNAVIVDWEIWETFMKNGSFSKSSNSMVFDNLEDGNIEVEYIIRATEVGEFSLTLKLITKYRDERAITGVCTVSYIVDDLMIYLHTQMSECSILCPGELLYANKTSVYTLCLHNVSQIDANFLFGEIYGDKSDLICAKVFPTTGFVPAKTFKRVNLELTPLEVCVFESLYLPCDIITYNPLIKGKYVEKNPLILVILCVVEDVNVQLIIPGMEKPVYWPPQMIYDLEYRIEQEKCVRESKSSSEVEEVKCFSKTDFAEETVINDITEYLHNLMQEIGEEEVEPIKHEDTISSSSFSELSSDSLREYFEEDIFIHENHMEFNGVPLRTPIKKTIAIQNMTPVEGFLEVDVANFRPVSMTTRSIHNILVDLNVKKDDHWESILGNDGVIIKLELGKQHLDPYEGTFLDVWVYANTWGIYADEIQFQVNNIAPFLITVLIEVVGLPLEFPISKNSLNKHAKIRFGVVPYNSKSAKRKVYVRNTSRVPVSVVWHVFMKTLDCRDKPITLLFDIYHPNMKRLLDADVESTGNLILTHRKLCGFSNYDIFNISPRETFIDAGQTVAIDIVFNSESYVTQIGRTEIEANLVGYIHVANIYKKRDHIFMRKTGSQMHPLRMKIFASLDTPKLNLEAISNLSFAIHASIEVDKETISASKVLIFKNRNNFPMEVSFSIGDPFKILEIQYLDNLMADVKSSITILPDTCVYLKVCFNLVLDQLHNMANLIYNLVRHDEYQVYSVNFGTCSFKYFNELKIMHKGAMKQIIPAELEIYFPLIEITPLIDFGIVYIGNSRKMTLTIKNFTTCRVPFEVISDGEFIVTQTSGVLESCMKEEPFIYDIYVISIPCEYKLYEADIFVKTNVDFCQYSTKVRAIGSHNEKQFKLNTC